MKIIKRYFKKLFKIINTDEMKFLPGHLAYFFILSIVPAIRPTGARPITKLKVTIKLVRVIHLNYKILMELKY